MKLLSWNVNGIRACLKKGFLQSMAAEDPDIICLQETKAHPDQVDMVLEKYAHFWNSAEKKGYSGTAVFSKVKPLSVVNGMGSNEHDVEGRVITIEYKEFFLVNVYTPNAQPELARIDFRLRWEKSLRAYLLSLSKPAILCGDLNVAHTELDLARPDANHNNPGFSDEERGEFSALLAAGFVDTFRLFEKSGSHYSWWTYRANARANNVGWRIDYWVVAEKLRSQVKSSCILPEVMGSDHCPVVMEFD